MMSDLGLLKNDKSITMQERNYLDIHMLQSMLHGEIQFVDRHITKDKAGIV